MDSILQTIREVMPKRIFKSLQPIYHYKMALLSALFYRFPSRKIRVIGVTGTKGKSTTVEIINRILEEAGYKTALSNTIRYKVAGESFENKFKMSMPGRFFVQRLIRKAVNAGCDFLILEMTSQGVIQYRHKFIELDALVFTNLSPEHIESHGSYEKYVEAKVEIAKSLSKSGKRPRIVVVNGDDKENGKFLAVDAEIKKTFTVSDAVPSPLLGEFNRYNVAGAATLARALGIEEEIIKRALIDFKEVPGRVEFIKCGQDFEVIVDYAHTADSMEKLYKVFEGKRKICVFGATGGGRDGWKRKEMGKIADTYCDQIILTDDDAYDEDPAEIARQIQEGIKNKPSEIIVDRRLAISKALDCAKTGDVVLITGKGTDAYLMGPNGKKTPWSDAKITEEELRKILP